MAQMSQAHSFYQIRLSKIARVQLSIEQLLTDITIQYNISYYFLFSEAAG